MLADWNVSFDGDADDVLPGSTLVPCGLHKTNGRPRANASADAAVWAAPEKVGRASEGGAGQGDWSPWLNTSDYGQCSDFLRTACDPTSVFAKIPTMVAFNTSGDRTGHQVRKTPSWPRSWANFSLLWLYSHRNAWPTCIL